ncbi:MAG: B12-binding domain-containing radical SAM protein [Candidatus Hodarchaeales archaeon]|jgi:radical SAM superfamily enzyme YgiQ (UPF0313 family)
MHYDAIVIDSLISYQNIAFDFGIVNLRYNDEVMTLQNLMKHYYPEKNEAFANSTLNLEECGKLNGILLYDYLTKLGFKCALISNVLENEKKLDSLLSEGTRAVIVSTTWTFGIQEVKEATKLIRAYDAKVPIIAGGVLIYNSYLIYKQRNNEDFDYDSTKDQFFFVNENPELSEDINLFIVDRTGLETLTKVLNAIKEKKHYDGISNTAYYRNGNLVFNHRQPEKIDLNNQVVSWNKIESEYLPPILPVQLSLGCYFECKFCNFFHKHQCYTKMKENIKKELNSIRSRPEVKMIRFVDDSMPTDVVQAICEIMIEGRIEIPWTTFVRLDALNEKNVDLLKKTNCVDVQIGLESGDDRILKNMGKKANTDTYFRILDYLSELDISIRGSFIVGYPGENQESITNTIDFINALPTNKDATIYVGLAPFILLPLAPIYLESARKPYKLRGYLIDWEHESMKFSDVPNYLKEIFLSVSNDILFAYPGDPVDINFSKNLSYEVKLARQRYQRGIVQGLPEKELNVMKSELTHAVTRFQETIG